MFNAILIFLLKKYILFKVNEKVNSSDMNDRIATVMSNYSSMMEESNCK